MIMEIRGMLSHELTRVHDMLDQAFPHTPGSFFDQQVKADPLLRPEDTRILLEDGEIRSCVRVYFRTIYCNGETLRMGGIGDVGTHPEYQGKGFSTMLMNDAIEYMKKHKAAVSFLFTQINSFYEKTGYFTLPTLDLVMEPASSLKAVSYRPVHLDEDLEFLRRLYHRRNSQKTGPVVRDPDYWKGQMGFPRVDPNLTWIHEKQGRPVCYIRGFSAEEHLKLLEFGFEDGEEENLFRLIATMAAELLKKSVHLSYLSEEEVDLFASWRSMVQDNTALMIRLLQLDNISPLKVLFAPHRILFWESDRF
jgi:GNAT superfamily N-acetyltransferase